jgi:hypothetical protein|tara:strand:+ start:1044 stop:1499 length:456 start_codon:yes stop_codon:yes gene_type:complete
MAPKKLPNDALLTEILQKVSSAKTKKEKVDILLEYNNPGLRAILIINFDESLKFLLPEGAPPYRASDAPAGTDHTRLDNEYRGFYRFFKGGDSTIKGMKREQLYVQLLEGLHADEAELVILACNKDIQSKYRVTKQVVSEAFPSIEWGNRG